MADRPDRRRGRGSGDGPQLPHSARAGVGPRASHRPESVAGHLARPETAARRSRALAHRAGSVVLLVPRSAAANRHGAVRHACHGTERQPDRVPDGLCRRRHRRRQPGRRPSVGRQGGARACADRIHRHGRFRNPPLMVIAFVRAGRNQSDPRRLLRRPLCRPAQRAAPAAKRRSGKRPADGDEQFPEHVRHPAVIGRALGLHDGSAHERGSRHPRVRRFHAPRQCLRAGRRARVPRSFLAVAPDTHDLSHPDRRSGERALARPGAARVQPPVPRRRFSGRGVPAAVHPLHGLPAHLRALAAASPAEMDERDSRRAGTRGAGVARARAAGAHRRPRGLHFCGRRDQPDRQPAAVQARVRAHRRRSRRADRAGVSRSGLGQHLQFQGRPLFLEVARPGPLPGDRRIRQTAAVIHDRGRSAPGDDGTGIRRDLGAPACR